MLKVFFIKNNFKFTNIFSKTSVFLLILGLCIDISYSFASDSLFTKKDLEHTKHAIKYAEKAKWDQAFKEAKLINDKVVIDLIKWMKLRSGTATNFYDVTEFINKKPDWPEQKKLQQVAEDHINGSIDIVHLVEWFEKFQPVSNRGKKIFLDAKVKSFSSDINAIKHDHEIRKLIKQYWHVADMSEDDQSKFIRQYGKLLSQEDYYARISELIWKRNFKQAESLSRLVDKDHQKLFASRIKLLQGKISLTQLPNLVPSELLKDQGLSYDLIKIYEKNENIEAITKLLKNAHTPFIHSEEWWQSKARNIRELIKHKRYQEAYTIAKHHNKDDKCQNSEAEWMAGWLSLRYIGDPKTAKTHFHNFYQNVKYPMSLSRGAYWVALAAHKLGQSEETTKWLTIAAEFPYTFYGQLALLRLGQKTLNLPTEPKPSEQDKIYFFRNDLAKVAIILAKIGMKDLAKTFFVSAIKSSETQGEVLLVLNAAKQNLDLHNATEIAKLAIRERHVFSILAYPIISKLPSSVNIEKAVVHSIIRQETVFDPRAVSSAGAKGLMQLLPSSAKDLTKELNLKYKESSLLSDPQYNITLGSYYLGKFINNFDGSYILTFSSYNAGKHRALKWIDTYGDPRELKKIDEVIDWIELIPYQETRNYVQRVLENIQVYRTILNKSSSKKLYLADDLLPGRR